MKGITPTERIKNTPGHVYRYWEPGRVYICHICGTTEHRNGEYWWAGRWSHIEPPCASTGNSQKLWFNVANPDVDFPDLPDRGQFGYRKLLYVTADF